MLRTLVSSVRDVGDDLVVLDAVPYSGTVFDPSWNNATVIIN